MISTTALSRRIKRHVLKARHEFIAVCAPGLEQSVLNQLAELPIDLDDAHIVKGGVVFFGPLDAVYYTNLCLDTASRILLRVAQFPAISSPALFDRSLRIPWEHYVGFARGVQFRVTTRGSQLYHQKKVERIVYDGMRKRLTALGLDPVLSDNDYAASIEFHIRGVNDFFTISMNTSGAHLHKRGWRNQSTAAPIRETLAAYVLHTVKSTDFDLVVDPHCGSGTFTIEAARHASGYPPGFERRFSFELTPFFQHSKWERIKHQRIVDVRKPVSQKAYFGSDIDGDAVAIAQSNAEAAKVSDLTRFAVQESSMVDYRGLGGSHMSCLLVSNLPYGRRLLAEGMAIGRFIRQVNENCAGWHVALLTREPTILNSIHLINRANTRLINGGLEVNLTTGLVANG